MNEHENKLIGGFGDMKPVDYFNQSRVEGILRSAVDAILRERAEREMPKIIERLSLLEEEEK